VKVFVHAGNNTIPLQLQSLAAGVYTISIRGTGNKAKGVRFVKVN
jgi:hypothetical protein